MIVNGGSCSKTNLVIINLLLRTHPAQQLFSSLGRIFQLLTIMIAVTNGSEGLFYGKGQHFLQVFTWLSNLSEKRGSEWTEAVCTVFQVDKNYSFHYLVHCTSKHFSLVRQFSKFETNWKTNIWKHSKKIYCSSETTLQQKMKYLFISIA